MFGRILTPALAAGILVGIVVSALQAYTTLPLIHGAEEYEMAGADVPDNRSAPTTGSIARDAGALQRHQTNAKEPQDHVAHAKEPWTPDDGIERFLLTVTANVVTAVGFGLILVACFVFRGGAVDGRTGALWGMAGFAVFTLAPALGLPPELPATVAADLHGRQLWWLLAAASTAGCLWLVLFRARIWEKGAGVVLALLPHVIGAPHPGEHSKAVPPELAAQFAATSIVVSAVFWVLLGWLAGTVYRQMSKATAGESAEAVA
jgi:cobalt transporter subunit CbtA